jgi:hypothetical protein
VARSRDRHKRDKERTRCNLVQIFQFGPNIQCRVAARTAYADPRIGGRAVRATKNADVTYTMIAMRSFLRVNFAFNRIGLASRIGLLPVGKVHSEQIGPNRRRRVGAPRKRHRGYGVSDLRASLLKLGIRC